MDVDCSAVIEADITIIQLLIAARRQGGGGGG